MDLKRDNLRCASVGKRRSLQELALHGGVCDSRRNTGTNVYISQEKILSPCLTNIPTHLPRRQHPGCCPPSEVQGLVSEYGLEQGRGVNRGVKDSVWGGIWKSVSDSPKEASN